jgi:hypothetical protein
MLDAHRQQQEARMTATHAEQAWASARYSSSATNDEVKKAKRSKLAAQRAFGRAWDDYLVTAQILCYFVERLVELEESEPAT